MGFLNWNNVARCLHNHEVSVNHLQAMLTYHEARRRLKMNSSINDYLESATCKKLKYWKKILHRLLAIIQYLAENNLSFRGSACHETIGDPKNGHFLGPSDQFFVYKDHCFVNMQRFHLDIYNFIIRYLAGIQVYLYLYIIMSTVVESNFTAEKSL